MRDKSKIINTKNSIECEKALRYKAKQFILYLAQNSIYAKVVGIYQYSIKVKIVRVYECYGQILIYYKPTKMQYKFSTAEIKNDEMKEFLQTLWDRMNDEVIIEMKKYVIEINL